MSKAYLRHTWSDSVSENGNNCNLRLLEDPPGYWDVLGEIGERLVGAPSLGCSDKYSNSSRRPQEFMNAQYRWTLIFELIIVSGSCATVNQREMSYLASLRRATLCSVHLLLDSGSSWDSLVGAGSKPASSAICESMMELRTLALS